MVSRNSANTYITPTSTNEVVSPSQPAFLAYQGTQDNDETGDATSFYLGDTDVGTALTEVFDRNSDFVVGASGGAVFTAPVTGRYCLLASINAGGYDGTQNVNIIYFNSSNGEFQTFRLNPTNVRDSSNIISGGGSTLCDMDAADTVLIRLVSSGGNKSVDILNTNRNTYFSGYLAV